MSVPTPDLLWLAAQEVLDCVCEDLTAQSSCGCPCRSFVTIGQPVWDNCCDGQLAVIVDRIYVAGVYPASDAQPITCTSQIAGEFTLQLIRCVPTMTEGGDPPTAAALSASAQNIYADMYIAYRSVICCLAQYKKQRLFTMRDARTIGPQGGCAGFEVKFSIQLIDPIPEVQKVENGNHICSTQQTARV